MSRGKLRNVASVCADCGTTDPEWASVNRGILICNECCSIHRSLGRHISQVKCLKKGTWSPPQLAMVHTLYNNGANSIWEHSLLDPSQGGKGVRRKPNPRDPIHPNKADFIRAKHQMLVYVLRPGKDSSVQDEELSQQLHASVRTANVETSLRLLSLGADPNYMSTEKGTSCLHVASKEGQSSQIELLVVYGAEAGILDVEGKSPVHYAREGGNIHLADRLVECQYELTDRLAYYLCGRKPDHQANQHYIIPEMADSSLDLSELAKAARIKLQALPNNLFEELSMDVYDEVDRRETDAIWLSMQNQSSLTSDRQCVPFLPVNPGFSATRNQGRQKLARFNAREFTTLIIDVLSDAKRRQFGCSLLKDGVGLKAPRRTISAISDDEPLYDIVASDDESNAKSIKENVINSSMASISSSINTSSRGNHLVTPTSSSSDSHSHKSLGFSDVGEEQISTEDYTNTKKQLDDSKKAVVQLCKVNDDMKDEISLLQKLVHNLMKENLDLKSKFSSNNKTKNVNGLDPIIPPPPQYLPFKNNNKSNVAALKTVPEACSTPSIHQRPVSMYEPREQQRIARDLRHSDAIRRDANRNCDALISRDDSGLGRSSRHSGQSYDYGSLETVLSNCDKSQNSLDLTSPVEEAIEGPTRLPTQEETIDQTKRITRSIQDLLSSAQQGKQESFLMLSENVYGAVSNMVSLFPDKPDRKSVKEALQKLLGSALRLHAECKQRHLDNVKDITSIDVIIQRAYDIALANKELVNSFQPT